MLTSYKQSWIFKFIMFHYVCAWFFFQVSFILGVVPVFMSWIYSELLEYKKSLLPPKP